MQNLYRIRPKMPGYEGRIIRFVPNRFQRHKYNLVYCDGVKRIIELKSRKFGTTTGWAIDNLDETAYAKKFFQIVTMAYDSEKAEEIYNDIVKLAWDQIAKPLRPKTKYNTKRALDFSEHRGSKYVVSTDVKGTTPNRLHITEAGYFKDDEVIKESILSVPPTGQIIVESTAHGMGNWFEQTFSEAWVAAQKGEKTNWHPIFHPWFDDPVNRDLSPDGYVFKYESEARALQEEYGLDEAQTVWWDKQKRDLRDLVYQFFPSHPEEAFIHSGRPVFNQENLRRIKPAARAPIKIEDDIEIFMEPEADKHYGIGVDTSEGLAHGDNGSIEVVCLETGEEMAQCTGKFAPHILAQKLGKVCRMFPDHLAVIERNNHGHTVIAYAKEDPAINLYQRQEKDKITEKTTTVIGWDTNERSKALAINTLSRDLEDSKCLPHSIETHDELRTYVHGERGIMGAMTGKKDDRVIALSLANLACREIVIIGSLSAADLGIY